MAWTLGDSRGACVLLVAVVLAACGGNRVPRWGVGDSDDGPDGVAVEIALSSSDREQLGALTSQLQPLATLTSQQLLARHPLHFKNELGYDPRAAAGLSVIQASGHALGPAALKKLATQGFVIDPKQQFPSMGYGYKSIYAQDLPVYVSLDSILNTVYLSYDAILMSIEREILIGELTTMLTDIRYGLPGLSTSDPNVAADLDLYTAVALGVLTGHRQEPTAGADAETIDALVGMATAAQGIHEVELFGVKRQMDFSQMKPRGHYTRGDSLQRYFRAMMWLGRTDFRLIETLPNGEQVLRTRQLAAVIALRRLIVDEALDAYDRIDAVVSAFVGQHDYMHLNQIDALVEDLDLDQLSDLYTVEPKVIAQTIIDGGYGVQRIASQVICGGSSSEPLPLDRSFALLGQRYVIDSQVFSSVVFDRVAPTEHGERTLPDPLDAAYAALGNSTALPLLRAGLEKYQYAPQLEQMRVLVDAHDASFWKENLYNHWLTALRAVSPREVPDPNLPAVALSEAWSRRILNTQLGSWSQLRHNTVLYAKQSYGSGSECEFPDAYVDPYPEAFAALVRYAKYGQGMAEALGASLSNDLGTRVRSYFDELASVAAILQEMAEHQRAGAPFNETQLAFINDLVAITPGVACGPGPHFTGWYARLLFNKNPNVQDPSIADVHTFPGGDAAPLVLHVATGLPRLMVVTVNSCTGPRAYAGLAFAYHEVITGLDRLTDETWAPIAPTAPDVPWMRPVLPSQR